MVQDNPYLKVWRSLSLDQTELNIFGKYSNWIKFRKMIFTPLINIDNLNLFKIKPLWSLMIKGERNKDISDREGIWHSGRDMTKEGDQLKL